jgi:mRNA interferase YafQ
MVERLMDGAPLPPECRDHPPRGDFAGTRDCHLGSDWLLLDTLTEKGAHVCFERTDTHSDLFR